MTRDRDRRSVVTADDGAILIIAIVVVTAVALVVGAVLTRGDGSLRATVALREVAGSSYAADAAANVAINNLRTGQGFAGNPTESGFNNSLDGVGCFGNNVGVGGTDKLSLDGFYPATGSLGPSSALVECTGESGTGMQSSPVPINNSNKPGYAIVTLNGPLTTADTLKVHGGVYANSSINGPVSLDAGDACGLRCLHPDHVVAPAAKTLQLRGQDHRPQLRQRPGRLGSCSPDSADVLHGRGGDLQAGLLRQCGEADHCHQPVLDGVVQARYLLLRLPQRRLRQRLPEQPLRHGRQRVDHQRRRCRRGYADQRERQSDRCTLDQPDVPRFLPEPDHRHPRGRRPVRLRWQQPHVHRPELTRGASAAPTAPASRRSRSTA